MCSHGPAPMSTTGQAGELADPQPVRGGFSDGDQHLGVADLAAGWLFA
jgi:hypothetical protein